MTTPRFFLIAALIILAGCGPSRSKRVPVAGTVRIDGQPVTSGVVQIVPANDRAAIGAIDAQGHFSMTTYDKDDGCVLGVHPVAVVANETIAKDTIRWLVPRKYGDVTTSDLKVPIDGPTDHLAIELTWAGGKPEIIKSGAPK